MGQAAFTFVEQAASLSTAGPVASSLPLTIRTAAFPTPRALSPSLPLSANPSSDREARVFPRPIVQGKFFQVGSRRLDVCGVTYGPFSGPDGLGDGDTVARDLAQMRLHGINTVRVYTIPPKWFLDLTHEFGLFVMIGLAWEQHVAFLDDARLCAQIESRIGAQVRSVAGHPAILCFLIGNEISPSIVRWHGPARVERFLRRLYRMAKANDPGALVSYANFPSTQYLHLPFLDFVSFNIYLENRDALARHLASLHHEADERPLLLTEVGLDSNEHGEPTQAHVLDWQVRTAFAEGCAGVVLFSWTDEWAWANGVNTDQWRFGLTTVQRVAKPTLDAVSRAFREMPFEPAFDWPRATVIVCTFNGSRTLTECLEGVLLLEYPDVQVIVVNDGSTDSTEDILARFSQKLTVISQGNSGLSSARNAGLKAATGDVVAYLDDDARPDPRWLKHLVRALWQSTEYAGVGGPNLPVPEDGMTAACVALSPGGPTHVMIDERIAEHVPGCNMAFRKRELETIGGFDPQFWIAGDDVDICWRLQEYGFKLVYSPAAVVWHHRRNTLGGYWRQQVNYGKAEAELERKWPHKYNLTGHVAWAGRIYSRGPGLSLGRGRRDIFYGTWGAALFQKAHAIAPSLVAVLPTMPDWYMAIALLSVLSLLGTIWKPLLIAVPVLAMAVGATLVMAMCCFARQMRSQHGSHATVSRSNLSAFKPAALIAFLHVMQPIARLWGRTCGGLTPWRSCDVRQLAEHTNHRVARRRLAVFPRSRTLAFWSETEKPHVARLAALKDALRDGGVAVRCGGACDRWDLEVRGGTVATARIWTSVQEHGNSRQLTMVRIRPRWHLIPVLLAAAVAAVAATAWVQSGVGLASALLTAAALIMVYRLWRDAALASGAGPGGTEWVS